MLLFDRYYFNDRFDIARIASGEWVVLDKIDECLVFRFDNEIDAHHFAAEYYK